MVSPRRRVGKRLANAEADRIGWLALKVARD